MCEEKVSKRRRVLFVLCIVVLLVAAGAITVFRLNQTRDTPTPTASTQQKKSAPQKHTYTLNLLSDKTYDTNSTNKFVFDIRDETNAVVKNFDSPHGQLLQVVVTRKDLTNLQLLTPSYDKSTGQFTIPNLVFPADGVYRIFAEFTPQNAQKDDMGAKLVSTPHQDVTVGSGQYVSRTSEDDRLTYSTDGFTTELAQLGGDSPGIPVAYAGMQVPLALTLDKGGTPYKNLEPVDGLLGRMIIISPDLQLIPVAQQPEASTLQNGLLLFNVTFPGAGQYQIYVQIKAEDKIEMFKYSLTVQPMLNSNDTAKP